MPSRTRWGETGQVDFSRPCGAWLHGFGRSDSTQAAGRVCRRCSPLAILSAVIGSIRLATAVRSGAA